MASTSVLERVARKEGSMAKGKDEGLIAACYCDLYMGEGKGQRARVYAVAYSVCSGAGSEFLGAVFTM